MRQPGSKRKPGGRKGVVMSTGNDILKAALSFAARGWPAIPLWWPLPGGRCACGDVKCESPGKHPIIKDWVKQGATDETTIRQWWAKWPKANVGILTGDRSGILLLDVDTKDDGPDHIATLEAQYGKLPDTVEAITGSGGRHVLFRYPQGRVIPNKARFHSGLDARSNGGMFVAAPSLHSNGRRYEWDAFFHPDTTPLTDAPEWLLQLMERKPHGKTAPPVEEYITEGARNSTLTSLAGTMRRRGMSPEAIFAALMAENLKRCVPPLDEGEVQAIAESVSKYPPEAEEGSKHQNGQLKSEGFNLTDLGNARRFIAQHGQDIRYCYAWGKWLLWNGTRWIKDDTGGIYRKAKETVARIYSEAANATDSEERKALGKHAARSESEARIKAMVSLTESEHGVPVIPSELDGDPWLLNCLSGTVSLRTGELLPHRREDLITKLVPVTFDMEADCPTWISFLHSIFHDNNNLITFIQKALGYALTGDTREQVIFFFYGAGANGKSTLIDVILSLLGDYALQTPTETLMLTDRGSISNDIARLKGSRFVSAVEAGEGRRMAEVLVKQLTGGDTISARFLHQEFFDFKPTCKIFLATNHRPVIKGTDHGIWRRIRLIPFTVTIPEEEQDKNLLDKLKAELPGILAWVARGCMGWQELGLGMPEEVKAATEGYRAEMDVVAGFIEECCHIAPYASVQASAIYETYRKWCIENGEDAQNQRKFGSALTERGFKRERGTGGRHFWKGLGLIEVPNSSSKAI